jgi:hypothetical protein
LLRAPISLLTENIADRYRKNETSGLVVILKAGWLLAEGEGTASTTTRQRFASKAPTMNKGMSSAASSIYFSRAYWPLVM